MTWDVKLSGQWRGPLQTGTGVFVAVSLSIVFWHGGSRTEWNPVRQEPCSFRVWGTRTDTAKARELVMMGSELMRLGDSAIAILRRVPYGDEGPNQDLLLSAAHLALQAAGVGGPRYVPGLLLASRLSYRASALGEGRVDTIWAGRATCYASLAVTEARGQFLRPEADSAEALLVVIRDALDAERSTDGVAPVRR